MTTSPRRIAFCITELDPGGAERALVQIATRIDRSLWEPKVYCLREPGEMVQPLEAASIPVMCFNVRSRWDIGVVQRLRRELGSYRPDVLQTFLFHANMAGRLAARGGVVPVVVSGVRVFERDAPWRLRLDRLTNRLVTHNVCVSESVAKAYRELGFSESKLSVIPNGVDAESFRNTSPADLSRFGIPGGATTLLGVGRLHFQKGFDILLKAAQPLLDDQPNMHVLIAGEGSSQSELEAMRTRFNEPERIHFVGRQYDIPALMRACDLFVLSSRWEGMPNVLLEAMAAGRPVVATEVEGVREVLIDGQTGIVVAPESPEQLREGIERLVNDAHWAQALGDAAQQRVIDQFAWERTVDRFTSLWQNLANHPT